MTLSGTSFIGFSRGKGTQHCGNGINPATGEILKPDTMCATEEEISHALELADSASQTFRNLSGQDKADLLRTIAQNLRQLEEEIATLGPLETGLPEARMRGELGRTTGQLELFASMIEEGSWIDARIETAIPDRAPIPKVDLRSMLRPLGPVVVFGAANFPLAFSVAGGDTAAALAAGCPVIVKAHNAHPGISELVAHAVIDAGKKTGMPDGFFSLLFGAGNEIGAKLAAAEQIKAIGFTGSQSGGRALMDIAAARKNPIPVFAEMSSINPVIYTESSLEGKLESAAVAFLQSLTLGAGQFCTNPGLIFIPTKQAEGFANELKASFAKFTAPGTMLNKDIWTHFKEGIEFLQSADAVRSLLLHKPDQSCQSGTAIFQTDAPNLIRNPALQREVFGPATLIVTYESPSELISAIKTLEGQLTATIQGESINPELISEIEKIAGRLILNGFPTGVEVCQSMVHGGPYPASSDGRSTSVGNMAIYRFTRLVSYQNFPQNLLPRELQDSNPLNIRRLINSKLQQP